MDQTHIVIERVVYFPKDQKDWDDVSITAQGYNLIWGTRFEVHVDQVMDTAEEIQDIEMRA